MSPQPIEAHGVIGDLQTVALVGIDAAIDFLCFPRFDSPTVFAALLDDARGGRFQIAPSLDQARRKQLYLPDSNILLSRFFSDAGIAEISDFMPLQDPPAVRAVVRRAKTVKGEVRYRLICAPRFDYARGNHRVQVVAGGVVFVPERKDLPALRLRSAVPLRVDTKDAVAEFTLKTGETADFILEEAPAGGESPWEAAGHVARAFKDTLNFWRAWIGRSTYQGRWREMVNRSALALKLLTFRPSGSMVAAPTFGLPEALGGERNWDYRYTWIRDASFTLYAFIRLGYTEEATAFMRWIEARCAEATGEGSLQIMYRLDGGRTPAEEALPHLTGYGHSSPVRIGNAAAQQVQLDIYGALMDSVYLYDKYGRPISSSLWADLVRLLTWVCRHWREPDDGIWEVRGRRLEFLYSRLMCWVAVDRAIRLAQKRSFPAPLEEWRRVRDEIYGDIFARFWDVERSAFVQSPGAKATDAAALLMPLVRFISPTDPRWLSTLRAIEADLANDALVYRYRPGETAVDTLSGREGTFSMCSFWYAECWSRAGDLHKARLLFEKMLGHANHLGLYSEELSLGGEFLGNFPQAFTQLALISAAYDLNRRLVAARD